MVDDELVTDGRTPETLTNDGLLVMVYSNLVLFCYDFFSRFEYGYRREEQWSH